MVHLPGKKYKPLFFREWLSLKNNKNLHLWISPFSYYGAGAFFMKWKKADAIIAR
jgi:hypothetical protein